MGTVMGREIGRTEFEKICKTQKFKDVKKFCYNKLKIENSGYFSNIFLESCINGHLKIAKWIFSEIFNDKCDFDNDDDIDTYIGIDTFVFPSVCSSGYLKIAKWLLSIKPNIDISADNDDTFCLTCSNGHLTISKWLLSIKPNINLFPIFDMEYSFKKKKINCFLQQKLKNTLYLVNINPRIYFKKLQIVKLL